MAFEQHEDADGSIRVPARGGVDAEGAGADLPVGANLHADNCSEKGFLGSAASKHGIAIVYPDTSPRGAG
ncbi:hypothetical protein E0Z10_g8949, partial [Xylaria hypoxylon]